MFAKLKNKLSLIFTKSWSFLRPKSKLGLVSFVILSSLFITAWFVFTPAAKAFGVDDIMNWFAGIFFAIAGFFIKLTFWVLKFVIEIAGYNGYIDSPAVTVGWVMVRDMTNMFFIVVLLIISFGTILGLEHYEYKKLLVKVLMAAVIVNFSRIICGVIIDIAQVVMLTFVNGIAATAAGNLTSMFNIQEIFKLGNGGTSAASSAGLTTAPAVFIASIAALVFGTMMLITMATFLLLLMARMAMLWVLIVLSPFAFVLNVLPQTEKYASQWWGQFGGHVVGGPVIVFFLWLSFVTVGTGNAHDDIVNHNALKGGNLMEENTTDPAQMTGITSVMSWAKMANFAIAIAMLLAGAKMATELGMAGGQMMGKAGEIGKKVAMYASGFNAARWAGAGIYGGVSKGVGKAGSAVGMYLAQPFIRTGKTVGGFVGANWKRLNFLRNEGAKGLETDTKKIRDLKFKMKNNQITDEQFEQELGGIKDKKVAKSLRMDHLNRKKAKGEIGQAAYDEGVKGIESKYQEELKAAETKREENKKKRAEKLAQLKAMKDSGQITEEQYNKGLREANKKYGDDGSQGLFFGSGIVGRTIKGALAGFIETGGRKMDRADNWMEAYEEAKEREELEYSNSSFAGGQFKREMGALKEGSEETKKAKGERKRAEMLVGAMRDLQHAIQSTQAKQAANMLKAEFQNRDWKGRQEVAKTDAEHTVLEDEKNKALKKNMRSSEAAAKAKKEGHHADEEKEMMAEEIKQLNEAIEELEKTVVGANGETVKEVEEQIKVKRTELGLLEEAKNNLKNRKDPNATFKSQEVLDLLSKITAASTMSAGGDDQKKAVADIKANENYGMMFGDQSVEEMISDQRKLDALNNIKKAIDAGKAGFDNGKKFEDVLGAISQTTAASVKLGVQSLSNTWAEAAHHSPSLYAARSSALRDNEYAFYRGDKQKVKDNASQAEVWDKVGIETPYGVSQQSVAEELYGKIFKEMNYNQTMAAYNAYTKHVKSKEGKITDRERTVSMAIMEKMLAERWVDDGTMYTRGQELGLQGSQVTGLKQRRGIHHGEKIRLSKPDIETLTEGLGGLAGFDHKIIQAIKDKQENVIDDFVNRFGKEIDQNPSRFMGKKAAELAHLIQHTEDDQHAELIRALENKLKP